jgi:hypothetical protein
MLGLASWRQSVNVECSLAWLLYSIYQISSSSSYWLVVAAHLCFTMQEMWSVLIGWVHSPYLDHYFLVDLKSHEKFSAVVNLCLTCVNIWLD